MSTSPSYEGLFLSSDPALARDSAAPYAVLPIPYERTVSYGTGTSRGPAAILSASLQIEEFDEEFRAPFGLRVQTLPALGFAGLTEGEAMDRIYLAARRVLSRRRFLLSLGGEHTITGPLVAAARSVAGCRSVLQIDAHTDLRTEYTGTPFSHACVMRRVREMGVRTVGVGIRSVSPREHDYILAEQVPLFWARDIAEAHDESWIRRVVDLLDEPVYITVDVDGFDPSLMPGTGTPEPGGLSWYPVMRLLRSASEARRVIAADVVELAPIPGPAVSEFTAARLAARILSYHHHGRH